MSPTLDARHPFSKGPLDISPENRQRFEVFLRSIIEDDAISVKDVEELHRQYYVLHAQRLQALLDLGDSLPIPLGPVTLSVLEWFSNSDRGKGGYALFLQRKGCWPRKTPTKPLHSSFTEVPLDVSEIGRASFEAFLLGIVIDEENSWEAIEALHMLHMGLHSSRLEAVRDAGVKLHELTDAALDWFLRSSDKGSYGIYLEARGMDIVVDKTSSEPEENGKVKPTTQKHFTAVRGPPHAVKTESSGVTIKTQTSNADADYSGSRKRNREESASTDTEYDDRPTKQQRVNPPPRPLRWQIVPGLRQSLLVQAVPESTHASKPLVVRTGRARCLRCIGQQLMKCVPPERPRQKACKECIKTKSSCSLVRK